MNLHRRVGRMHVLEIDEVALLVQGDQRRQEAVALRRCEVVRVLADSHHQGLGPDHRAIGHVGDADGCIAVCRAGKTLTATGGVKPACDPALNVVGAGWGPSGHIELDRVGGPAIG